MEVATLREKLDELGPWCHELVIAEGVSTREWRERHPDCDVPWVNPMITSVGTHMRRVFRRDFARRTVLDCGCNAGGYSFLARQLGAGNCFGFDVREHWIRQARFVAEARGYRGMQFEVMDLYDLDCEPFDVTVFSGLLYHLPDPIRGLKMVADLTREVIFVDTASRAGMPDGHLAVENESTEILVSGVYGLNWLPTGPEVLRKMLVWAGFPETRCVNHRPIDKDTNRLGMVGSKVPGLLAHIPDSPELATAVESEGT